MDSDMARVKLVCFTNQPLFFAFWSKQQTTSNKQHLEEKQPDPVRKTFGFCTYFMQMKWINQPMNRKFQITCNLSRLMYIYIYISDILMSSTVIVAFSQNDLDPDKWIHNFKAELQILKLFLPTPNAFQWFSVFFWKKSDPNITAMPVIAMVNRTRLCENSCGGLLRPPCSLSAALASLLADSKWTTSMKL